MSTPNPPYPPQPPYATPAPDPKKKHGCLVALIVFAIIAVLAIVITIAVTAAIGKGVSDVTSADHTITYKVTTTTKTSITYGASTGTSQETVTANWTKDQKVQGIEIATLVATLDFQAPDTASVTCEVLIDGKSQSTNTSKGAGAMASCTGTTTK